MRIGVDIGGTFTDFVIQDTADGTTTRFKVPSTPDAPDRAVLQGLKRISLEPESTIIHGSTVATNAVLERKGARTAFVTTEGFRDLLTIGRQNRRELYEFFADRSEPLIPSERSYVVRERVNHRGDVQVPLDQGSVQEIVGQLEKEAIESIAICLLYSFLHPDHERLVASELRRAGFYVSASSEILPEFREYERASTTAINAYVMPAMERYLGNLETSISPGRLRVMQSDGGSLSAQQAREQPVRAVLSGPAGGVVGAIHLASSAGFNEIISFDMGGTSTDVSLAMGTQKLTSEGNIDGLPLRTSMIDIHTVGSGGGSIARLDQGGSLRVGPESAGSDPGPACYGFGGEKPTVTDANLVLGRLDASRFLGGQMMLDEDAGYQALTELATALGIDPRQAALGVISVVNANMARAIRLISVERGHDPREFVLVSFGGAGGLHACDVARLVGIRRVLVPPQASTLSAYGMLVAEVTKDYVQTVMLPGSGPTDTIDRVISDLKRQASMDLAREGIPPDRIELFQDLDLRYTGQSYELTIPYVDEFAAEFHRAHEMVYGYSEPDISIEVVNVRLRAVGHVEKHVPASSELRGKSPQRAHLGSQDVNLSPNEMSNLPIYDGESIQPGNRVDGPAIISYSDTTVFLNVSDNAVMDEYRNLIIEVGD